MTNDQKPIHKLGNHASDLRLLVGVAGRYSNRSDLLEQLRKVARILSDDRRDDKTGTGAEIVIPRSPVRSRRLRDRFSPEDLQAMIDLYRSGATAKAVAEKFGVSLRSIKRLLRKHGVCRERRNRPALSEPCWLRGQRS